MEAGAKHLVTRSLRDAPRRNWSARRRHPVFGPEHQIEEAGDEFLWSECAMAVSIAGAGDQTLHEPIGIAGGRDGCAVSAEMEARNDGVTERRQRERGNPKIAGRRVIVLDLIQPRWRSRIPPDARVDRLELRGREGARVLRRQVVE